MLVCLTACLIVGSVAPVVGSPVTPGAPSAAGPESGLTGVDGTATGLAATDGADQTGENNTVTENFTDRDDLQRVDADWVSKEQYRLWGHYQFDDAYDRGILEPYSTGYGGEALEYRPAEGGWYFNVSDGDSVEASIDVWDDRFADRLGPQFEITVDYQGLESCRAMTSAGIWDNPDSQWTTYLHWVRINDGQYRISNDSGYWNGGGWSDGLTSVSGNAETVTLETVLGQDRYMIWGSFPTYGDGSDPSVPTFRPRDDDRQLDYIYFWFHGPDRYDGCQADTNSGYIDEVTTPYDLNGTIASTDINPTDSAVDTARLNATAQVPSNTNIDYYMTVDGGDHWEQVEPGAYHQFDQSGSDVRWKAVLERGRYNSNESPVLKNVSVTVDTPPRGEAGANRTTIVGESVTLDASNSTDDRGITAYEWDPDDDGTYERSGPTTTVAVETNGTRTVGLRVTDTAGHTATDTVSITAEENTPPRVDAGANTTAPVDESVTLDASNSTDPQGHDLSYEWAVVARPDGSTAQLSDAVTVSPSFTPDVPGTYRFELTVTDAYGLNATDTVTIVTDGDPVVETANHRTTTTGDPVTLDGRNSTDPEGGPLTYAWEIDEAPRAARPTLPTPANASTTFTPNVAGTYEVALTVTDPQGNTGTDTVAVTANAPPNASFESTPGSPTAEDPVRFDASSSVDPDGTVETYRWDFDGDGTVDATTEMPTVNHTYATGGRTRASLTVVDGDGLNDTTTTSVRVEPQGPPVLSNLVVTSPTNASAATVAEAGGTVTVEATVMFDRRLDRVPNTINRFRARLGETEATTTVRDLSVGSDRRNVTATLTVTAPDVRPGWHDLHVTLHADPACEPGEPCATVIRTVEDTATDAVAYRLDDRDNEAPTARLSFAPEEPTTGDWLVFNGFESSDPDGSIQSYEWRFDGAEAADAIWGVGSGWYTDHRFETPGNHTVNLTVTDDAGATDTVRRTISVAEGSADSTSVDISGVEMRIRNIAECGLTCREVTYVVENPTDTPVSNLTADITLTSGGQTIWENERPVGDVPAGESTTLTDEMTLTQAETATILDNDGTVTIEVELTSANQTRTISFDRDFS